MSNTTNKSLATYPINNTLSINVADISTRHNEYFTFDFFDKETNSGFESYMSRDKLRGLAVFILNYLENN